MFINDISIDVTSKVMYRNSVFRNNLGKYLNFKIKYYRIQGLEFSYIAEMTITFTTSLYFITYKHYIEQPLPMFERMVNRRFYKINELIKTLDNIDITLQMGPYENGREDVYGSTDEGE